MITDPNHLIFSIEPVYIHSKEYQPILNALTVQFKDGKYKLRLKGTQLLVSIIKPLSEDELNSTKELIYRDKIVTKGLVDIIFDVTVPYNFLDPHIPDTPFELDKLNIKVINCGYYPQVESDDFTLNNNQDFLISQCKNEDNFGKLLSKNKISFIVIV